MGACTSSEGVHPDHNTLPGQEYLGRCWKLPTDSDDRGVSVPAWSRTSNGELPARGFHLVMPVDSATGELVRTPFFNKAAKRVNGYYAPGLRCDFDGLENNTQVFADSDVKTNTKTSLNFSVGVGLGTVEASVGAQKKEKHSAGRSDYFVIVTLETYRLSIDLAKTFYDSGDGTAEPFADAGSTSPQPQQAGAASPSTAVGGTAPPSSKIVRHAVDPTDDVAYGSGCVTQVKCGGQLLIRIKQTNYGEQVKAWGASVSAGLRAGVPTLGASGDKRKKGGDVRLDVEVHHAGGPELPPQFQNCTLDDIEGFVESWSKGLQNDVLLSVPLRVGVHTYAELKGQLVCTQSPLVAAQPSLAGGATASAKSLDDDEIAALRTRVRELEADLGARTSPASPIIPVAHASPTVAGSTDADCVLAAMVVPPIPGESSSVSAQRFAVASYIGKCVTGQIAEVDFSQVPDADEAVLWAGMSIHRFPNTITTLRLSGCRARGSVARLLVGLLRSVPTTAVLHTLDVSDNAIGPADAADLVEAATARVIAGGKPLTVYLDNNDERVVGSPLSPAAIPTAASLVDAKTRLAAAVLDAAAHGITVSV